MVSQGIADVVSLANGVAMPWFGLGVYKTPEGAVVRDAVRAALAAGYRHVDTAALYGNEVGVGEAIRESGLLRSDIFVTTKVWNSDQGYDSTLRAFDASLERLGFKYVDLYLIHWPVAGKYSETWRALERLYEDGRAKAIGVSNFTVNHLKDLAKSARILPMVNQVECHPLLTQQALRAYCQEQGIRVEAWSPLMRGRLDHPVLQTLAKEYGKTSAQIVLRWDLQHEIITIPKSVHASRILENAQVFDFSLSVADMQQIDEMNQNHRFGPDPDRFAF